MEVSNSKSDELDSFRKMDSVSYIDIVDRVVIRKHNFRCPVVAFANDSSLNLQSAIFSEGVPTLLLAINESLELKPSTWALGYPFLGLSKTTSGF